MLKMNVVKTQWAHVNRGVVNVHQDLRNDTRAICICVQMEYVMRKNVVAIHARLFMVLVILVQRNAGMQRMGTDSMGTIICTTNVA